MSLTITNGIIEESIIDGIPLVKHIITATGAKPNVRTGINLAGPIGITVHNTGNNAPSANALNHAIWLEGVEKSDTDYVGVHFFVDAERIVQTLPLNEATWHAGDGYGQGNMATISIEICETSPYETCENNAKILCAALLDAYGLTNLYTHKDWSGKYCPRLILARANGWQEFQADVKSLLSAKQMPAMTAPVLDNTASIWAQEAVDWALANRYLLGDTTGDYHLHTPLTREEGIVFLYRALGARG